MLVPNLDPVRLLLDPVSPPYITVSAISEVLLVGLDDLTRQVLRRWVHAAMTGMSG